MPLADGTPCVRAPGLDERFSGGPQHIDRPDDVETLSTPLGDRHPVVHAEPRGLVAVSQEQDGIGVRARRSRNLGQELRIRSPKPQLVVAQSLDPISLLVDRPMMPPTEQREIRQRGRPAPRPVSEVMAFCDAHAAAGEPTAPVAVLQCSP
jgi:hypothetical protein